MADVELPIDVGRVTHLTAQMHRSEDDAGDPIPEGYLLGADGLKGHNWYDPSGLSFSGDAVDVAVTDSAGYFTGTNVETILAELGALVEGVQAHGNTGSTETFAATKGVHTATLNANCTFTFTALASGLASGMVLILTQDGTGSRTVTWPGSVVWPGGSAPTLSTAAASVDVLTFLSVDGGTTWFGFLTGGGSSLTIKDEGSSLTTAASSIDFVGAGVTASGTGAAKTVTIPWPTLDNLTDVAITSPASGDRVRYNGSAWVNSSLRWEPHVDYTGSVVLDGAGNPVMVEVS